MSASQVAIRLGVEGGEQAKQAFDELARSGEGAFRIVALEAERAGDTLARQGPKWQQFSQGAKDAAVTTGSALKEIGGLIKDHPVLVAAGVSASAHALGTLSPALMAASVATRGLANDNAILAAGAGVVSSALAAGAGATASASSSARALAENLSPAVAATRLLTSAAGVAVPALAPLAAGLLAFKLGAEAVEKASDDLAKLVDIGKRAEALDVSAPFLKSVTGLGKQLRVEVADMEATLARAKELVTDKFQQPNQLGAHLSSLYTQGYGPGGGQPFEATRLLETATSTEEKIRAGVVAMTELDALGHRFAELNLAEKMFPAEMVDRLRTGQTTAAQLLADLDAAREREVLSQDDVARALELSRNIEAVKREIKDAWSVSVDFSGVAVTIDTAWLGILKTVRDVSAGMNEAIEGAGAKLKAWFDSDYWRAFSRYSQVEGGLSNTLHPPDPPNRVITDPPLPPERPIGSKSYPYMFGPPLSAMSTPERATRAPAGPSQDTLSGMDRYLIDLDKARDLAKAEYETIGLGNQARQRALDIAKARSAAERDFERGLRDSAALTDAETDRINAAADATARWKEQAKELQEGLSFTSDATKDFAKTFAGDMRQGKSAVEAVTDALDKLAARLMDKSLDMAIDSLFKGVGGGGGGLNGILAGLFSSGGGGSGISMTGPLTAAEAFFADGGIMTSRGRLPLHTYAGGGIANSPQVAIFAENRVPEAYVPVPSGKIPVEMRMPASLNRPASVTNNFNVHVAGNATPETSQEILQQLAQHIQKVDASVEGRATRAVADAYGRSTHYRRALGSR